VRVPALALDLLDREAEAGGMTRAQLVRGILLREVELLRDGWTRHGK
jgi:hypothetical protein